MALWAQWDLNLALERCIELEQQEGREGVECLGSDIGVGINTSCEMGGG